jgi:hypothetical protein
MISSAIWDIWMLIRILTECRVYAWPDGIGGLEFPAEQEQVIRSMIDLICDASEAKARMGMKAFPRTAILSMN